MGRNLTTDCVPTEMRYESDCVPQKIKLIHIASGEQVEAGIAMMVFKLSTVTSFHAYTASSVCPDGCLRVRMNVLSFLSVHRTQSIVEIAIMLTYLEGLK